MRKWGETTPPSEKGVKMFELAQLNLFTPDVKKGGGVEANGDSSPCAGRRWVWGAWTPIN